MIDLASLQPLDSELTATFDDLCRLGLEREHALQVTRVSLALFDLLAPLHKLDAAARRLLQWAALLHDIGWLERPRRHHKQSYRMIRVLSLPCDERARLQIALIARYHRKALPSTTHDGYSTLHRDERRRVAILAALLRCADGLDRQHDNSIIALGCAITPHVLHIHCQTSHAGEEELAAVMAKGILLERVFQRSLNVTWQISTPAPPTASSPLSTSALMPCGCSSSPSTATIPTAS
jgi:exopolyphosphatase/guanosine-5'-triphosphate,3'-diphosphate pyrophosphatase